MWHVIVMCQCLPSSLSSNGHKFLLSKQGMFFVSFGFQTSLRLPLGQNLREPGACSAGIIFWKMKLRSSSQPLAEPELQYLCTSSAHIFDIRRSTPRINAYLWHYSSATLHPRAAEPQEHSKALGLSYYTKIYESIYVYIYTWIHTYSIYDYNLSWLFLTYLSIHCRSSYEYMPT